MSTYDADFGASIPPPPRPIEYRDVDDRGWWLSILVGIALVAVGLWLITNLFESVTVLALLVGVSLVVGGIAEIVTLGGRGGLGWAAWAAGALVMIAGIVVLAWPHPTLWALAVMAGAALVIMGAVRIGTALEGHRSEPDWPVQLGIGVVSLVVGALVLAWPQATLEILAFLLGVRAIISGLVAIGTAWQIHRLARTT
jgi:uncharacterized membrane protein HdeD (DUF308 family)